MPRVLALSFLLVAACGPGPTVVAPEAGAAAPSPIDLRGTVLRPNGMPPAHPVTIAVRDHAPVLSAPDGSFQLSGVAVPYDVSVIDYRTQGATVYLGVSRPDPVLISIDSKAAPDRVATLTGQVSGFDPTWRTRATVDAAGSGNWQGRISEDGTLEFGAIEWEGPAQLGARLITGAAVVDSTGLPASYAGFAVQELSLQGGVATTAAVTLAQVGQSTVSGRETIPDGYWPDGRRLRIQLRSGNLPRLIDVLSFADASPEDSFSYNTPALPDGRLLVEAAASRDWVTSTRGVPIVQANAGDVRVDVKPGSEPLIPEQGATVPRSTTLRWAALEGAAYAVTISEPAYASSLPKITVVTTRTEIQIPDLSAYGLELPGATRYGWVVDAFAPLPSMDAAASVAFIQQWNGAYPDPWDHSRSIQWDFWLE